MRVFGDAEKEKLEQEIDKLRKEVKSTRYFNCILSVIIGVVLFVTLRGSISAMNYAITQELSQQTQTVDESDYVSVEKYNEVVKSVNELQSEVQSLSLEIESYEGRLAEYNANLLTDFVSSQIPGADIEPEFVENTDIQQSDPLYYHNGVIDSDGYVDKEYFESVVAYYNMVPENVRQAFADDGWNILVTTSSIHVDGISDTVVAVTMFKEKMIYVSTLDAESIIHEMGHYIDGRNNFASLDFDARTYASDLNGFMQLDGATHVHNYSTTPEYFAECFYLYITKHDDFKALCPGTYDFIVQNINNITSN